MNEKPIIFSTPMVKAILARRKTQTRRIVTPFRSGPCETAHKSWLDWETIIPNNPSGIKLKSKIDETVHRVYPPNNPGDLIWVREAFSIWREGIKYRADGESVLKGFKYKPSIHMPKAAARIWLKNTGVRVERLQDISEKDAIGEGVEIIKYNYPMNTPVYKDYTTNSKEFGWLNPINSFNSLWRSIHGDESCNENPYVWVINFEVLSTTRKPEPRTS